ncbi:MULTISPECIES: histidine--tRNA ligase [unclassified Leifsonia]|uniref:histidine--tRNA ligase n=1 Tax=unclassified Leifsonia TaxID=2663824 RepID=UPI0006FD8704|nr:MULTISPECIES: histidine--tRNA ligase [unclassified Leifsonia]KQX07476.1 histidine--tRNA ligase [Leifsonia sp. Root1293]KRA11758.1 histidine--tRNA ligase [Leifsonia sp. Root60]
MAQTVTPPRGMRDFLPADKARREHALGVIRSAYARHGFDEIETPVMEDAAYLHSGLGGDNEKLAFAVMRRGITSEMLAAAAEADDALGLADLGLRFDLTVPLARFYASHRAELPAVFRAIQIAPVWRAERPQKGRFRQFLQCDIDIIGESGALAEIELITATAAAIEALGLNGCRIRINDRRILTRLLDTWKVPAEQHERALITIDKLDKIGVTGVVDELGSLGITTDGIADTLASIENAGWHLHDGTLPPPAWLDLEVYAELRAIRDAVSGIELDFDPTLVRGMGYYTGTIFEISHPELTYSLGGGGRYDGMIGRFLGTDVPACGFSIGFERIVDLLDADDSARADAVLLVHDKDAEPASLVSLKGSLVESGARVRLAKRSKNVRALLERAEADGFTRYAFVASGETDAAALEFKAIG